VSNSCTERKEPYAATVRYRMWIERLTIDHDRHDDDDGDSNESF